MDVINIVATTVVTALTSGVVGAVVASAISAAKDKARDHTAFNADLAEFVSAKDEIIEKLDANTKASGCSMWREIKEIHHKAMTNGGLDVEERRQLECCFEAYESLGFNGTGKRLYQDAMNMPIID